MSVITRHRGNVKRVITLLRVLSTDPVAFSVGNRLPGWWSAPSGRLERFTEFLLYFFRQYYRNIRFIRRVFPH